MVLRGELGTHAKAVEYLHRPPLMAQDDMSEALHDDDRPMEHGHASDETLMDEPMSTSSPMGVSSKREASQEASEGRSTSRVRTESPGTEILAAIAEEQVQRPITEILMAGFLQKRRRKRSLQ